MSSHKNEAGCIAQNETAVTGASTRLTVFTFTANSCFNFLHKDAICVPIGTVDSKWISDLKIGT